MDKHFDKGSLRLTTREIPPPKHSSTKTAGAVKSIFLKFWHTSDFELIIRLLFLILLVCLLILVLYYEMILEDSAFERFMDSQSFAVRLLFTSLGTVVGRLWDYYFSLPSQLIERIGTHNLPESMTDISEHQPLQPPLYTSICSAVHLDSSALLDIHESLALHIAHSIPQIFQSTHQQARHHQIKVSLATLLAKFTPILFSAIPFRNTVAWKMHEACTWMG
ncbi:hypothetical protein V8F33_004106 [Rhypophila sp. PSN 637]